MNTKQLQGWRWLLSLVMWHNWQKSSNCHPLWMGSKRKAKVGKVLALCFSSVTHSSQCNFSNYSCVVLLKQGQEVWWGNTLGMWRSAVIIGASARFAPLPMLHAVYKLNLMMLKCACSSLCGRTNVGCAPALARTEVWTNCVPVCVLSRGQIC